MTELKSENTKSHLDKLKASDVELDSADDSIDDLAKSNFDINAPYVPLSNCIQLAACRSHEVLPQAPDLPADLFTCCLTTPIEMALRWFVISNQSRGITVDMTLKIPGRITDRRTPLGELNWIFTSITDTIAWSVLPPDLFLKLFR